MNRYEKIDDKIPLNKKMIMLMKKDVNSLKKLDQFSEREQKISQNEKF